MASTKHTFGVKSWLRKNTFTRNGYTFDNWTVCRKSDGKWYYMSGNKSGWYKKGAQPAGYNLGIYDDGGWLIKATAANNDVVTLYARWTKNDTQSKQYEHIVNFHNNDGNGVSSFYKVRNGEVIPFPAEDPTRDGYVFTGWYCKRMADATWHVQEAGWITWDKVTANKYTPRLYQSNEIHRMDSSWMKGSAESDYTFFAQWEKVE